MAPKEETARGLGPGFERDAKGLNYLKAGNILHREETREVLRSAYPEHMGFLSKGFEGLPDSPEENPFEWLNDPNVSEEDKLQRLDDEGFILGEDGYIYEKPVDSLETTESD